MAFYFCFFKFYFFAEFLGFQTKVISTPLGMTFDALVVYSLALDFGLNFILAHCALFRFLKRPLFTKFLIKISDTYKKTLENNYNLISDKKMERKATVHKFLPLLTNESALDNNSKKIYNSR